jgi:hypothetical protein
LIKRKLDKPFIIEHAYCGDYESIESDFKTIEDANDFIKNILPEKYKSNEREYWYRLFKIIEEKTCL